MKWCGGGISPTAPFYFLFYKKGEMKNMSKIVRINNRYYDFGTTNESFLQTAAELKTLGIKNWYFTLGQKGDPTSPS